MLRGRKVSLIDSRLVRVLVLDARGGEQSVEFQEFRILAGAHPIGKHSPRVRIDRMLQPPLGRFGPDKTPHFIYLGHASRRNVVVEWTRRGYQRGVDGVKCGGFFLRRRSLSWD